MSVSGTQPSRVSPFLLTTAFLATAFLLVATGCSREPDEKLCNRLYGVWNTSSPRYNGASLEISPDTILFRRVDGSVDYNSIIGMELTGNDSRGASIRIAYRNRSGDDFSLDLLLPMPSKRELLVFTNQQYLVWEKNSSTME